MEKVNATTGRKTSEGGNTMNEEIKRAIGTIVKAVKDGVIELDEVIDEITAETSKATTKKHWTKAYSDENVRTIQRMIEEGATTKKIMEYFGVKSPTTIRNYITRYNKNDDDVIQQYMDKLHSNNVAAKKSSAIQETEAKQEDTCVTDSDTIDEVNENSEKNVSEVIDDDDVMPVLNAPRYLLEADIIKYYDCRVKWDELIRMLKAENAEVFVHHFNKVYAIAKGHFNSSARKLAYEVLNDKFIDVIKTPLSIQNTAILIGAVVIVSRKKNERYYEGHGVSYILLDDYIASRTAKTNKHIEEYVIDPDDEEAVKWARKLSIPVTLNNNRKIIAEISELVRFAEKQYGEESAEVTIFDTNGKERKTPTGKVKLCTGDTIKIVGSIIVILKVYSETLAENAYEIYYTSVSDEVSSEKTATA